MENNRINCYGNIRAKGLVRRTPSWDYIIYDCDFIFFIHQTEIPIGAMDMSLIIFFSRTDPLPFSLSLSLNRCRNRPNLAGRPSRQTPGSAGVLLHPAKFFCLWHCDHSCPILLTYVLMFRLTYVGLPFPEIYRNRSAIWLNTFM